MTVSSAACQAVGAFGLLTSLMCIAWTIAVVIMECQGNL